MRRFLLGLPILLVANASWAGTYYVDGANGNDSNAGNSVAAPWRTISKAMTTVLAGDTILIKGGVYRERIKLYGKSGTAAQPITVRNYDNADVILDGSTPVTGWTTDTGSIYKANPGFVVSAVVIDNVPLRPAVTQTNTNAAYVDTTTRATVTINAGEFYQDNSSGLLYVWTPDGSSPSTHTVGVLLQIPTTDNTYDGIYLWDGSYYIFENLTVRFYGARGIEALGNSSNNIYRNLKIVFNGHTGIATGANAQLLNNTIAWNFMLNWPRGRFNGGTQGGGWGAGVNLGAGSVAQGNVIYKNGGEGILTYMNSGNTTFRGNTVFDNWSMNLYVDTSANALIENNLVYCTEPNLIDARNNGFPNDTTVIKGMRPIAIGTADEYYGGPKLYYLRDVTIRNNIVVNCRRGYNHYAQYTGSGMINIKMLNNTIITPDTVVPGTVTVGDRDNYIGILLDNSFNVNSGNEIKNNIVVARNARNFALYYQTTEADPFSSYDISNNIWYNTSNSTPIHWGSDYRAIYDYSLADWKVLPGSIHGVGDLSLNPQFTGGANLFSPEYYVPTLTSPAVGAGVVLAGYSADYFNVIRPAAWTMGALEAFPPSNLRIIIP